MRVVPVFVDFETFWAAHHSLTKMNPIAYVMHPETEIISVAIKLPGQDVQVVFGEAAVKAALQAVDWSDKMAVGHNLSGFDSMILAWRCGIRPKMWGCTLAMARPHHAKTPGLSLGALLAHYNLPGKDSTPLANTKGKHLAEFTPEEVESMRWYNAGDTAGCAQLFELLLPMTSKEEMILIDTTIRMLVEPQFEVDVTLLRTTQAEEKKRKHDSLIRLGTVLNLTMEMAGGPVTLAELVRGNLASAKKFAAFLETQGVEPPMKISPTTQLPAHAFAKTDEAFQALVEHENPLVAMAAQCRLDVKSTILESRIDAFLQATAAAGGLLPIPLSYYGADTTGRWSGWGYNPQNLNRIIVGQPKPSDALRNSMRAPKGYKVIVADLSGIEMRVNMFLWKVPYAMELFNADPTADLYKPLASEVLGVPMENMPTMVRQAGKAMHLGGGFGLRNPKKYQAVAKTMAQIIVSEEDAVRHIDGYRKKHQEVVVGWRTCHNSLDAVHVGADFTIDPWGLCHTIKDGIQTPKGVIRYPGLHQEEHDGKVEWWYGTGRNRARIYAGKIDENIVQHLARNVIAGHALRVRRELGLKLAMTCHDELVFVVPEDRAEELLAKVQAIMRTPPDWWSELVLHSEGAVADTYGRAH